MVGGQVGGARVSGRSQPVLDMVFNISLEGKLWLGAPVEKVCKVLLEGQAVCVGEGSRAGS